jgi:GT2 family glycosyltransferase
MPRDSSVRFENCVPSDSSHATADGKFLHVDGDRFLIKGVSYGTFAPNRNGELFPELGRIAMDFDAMVDMDANTVRTYTVPDVALLDEARRAGLRVIVGVPWTQHVAFLETRASQRAIRQRVREDVRRLAHHPAPLLFALGNEIPPGVIRWHGRDKVARFLKDLYDEAKSAAPDALLAYVNYPPTEYLDIPFFDVCAFNIFLHSADALSAYVARLHHLAGARPLLVAELGADSIRNGEQGQADLVRMQLQTAFREGACGAVVFSWTDDWWRGGQQVDDWAFGVVDAERIPKRTYHAVQHEFRCCSRAESDALPRVSVVVCAYNAADTIGECLAALESLNYPDYEVIVVDDGSTDRTADIARRYRSVRLVNIANCGLAAARNVGLEHATGRIVAYTDADTRVDRDWLVHLVRPFFNANVHAAGGPAVVPADDPWFAQCVARAPGAPTHVLLDDRIAEHVPGCNCAFRRDALSAIGGFNPVFIRAGDDVDVCWRIQQRGGDIGFAPAALVWHRHRATTRAYWRQQVGYGEGETWLMREHPDKFVRGQITWIGHIYSPLPFIRSLWSTRVNAGPFGSAGFPSVYRTDAHPFAYLPHSGRWQVAWVLMLLAAIPVLVTHRPYGRVLMGAAMVTLLATVLKCIVYGLHSDVSGLSLIGKLPRQASRFLYRASIAWLHFVQPFARLYGRARGALNRPAVPIAHGHAKSVASPRRPSPVRLSDVARAVRLCLFRSIEKVYWSERWVDTGDLLRATADRLRRQRAVRQIELDSGWWDDRDLTIADRTSVRLDVRLLLEDHGRGNCLCRCEVKPRLSAGVALPLVLAAAAVLALRQGGVSWALGSVPVAIVAVMFMIAAVLGTSRVVVAGLDAVMAEFGMAEVRPRRPGRQHEAPQSATPAGAPEFVVSARAATQEPSPSQAFAADV